MSDWFSSFPLVISWNFLAIAVALTARYAPPLNDPQQLANRSSNGQKIEEFEIPEDKIIQLPYAVFPEPHCDYSVHAGGPQGPTVTTASIGDLLYHKWQCRTFSQSEKLYCISVQNCTVGNHHRAYPIIDKHSCTMEPSIVPDITYKSDLEGGLLSHAFAIGFQEPTLAFRCKIKLLVKENGICPREQCPVGFNLK